jgi:hypothetical protein
MRMRIAGGAAGAMVVRARYELSPCGDCLGEWAGQEVGVPSHLGLGAGSCRATRAGAASGNNKHPAVKPTPTHLQTEPPARASTSTTATMEPPNMDDLSLSDSDSDALFDTPAARKGKKTAQGAAADTGDAAAGKTRAKESHYTAEEAREAALRRELESVRSVNKVIEGVVENLQKARNNMDVRTATTDTKWNRH